MITTYLDFGSHPLNYADFFCNTRAKRNYMQMINRLVLKTQHKMKFSQKRLS